MNLMAQKKTDRRQLGKTVSFSLPGDISNFSPVWTNSFRFLAWVVMIIGRLLEYVQTDLSPAEKNSFIFFTWRHKQFLASWQKQSRFSAWQRVFCLLIF